MIMSAALLGIASTPLCWLRGGPSGGQFVGATVQSAVAIIALAGSFLARPAAARSGRV
ncbi:hypothetical protein [Streptomyces sp. IBSBF 2435]|uniref:hypothetical protein n=1 Tax=Streptomyces sp. IBSBF 2435 TaxID=2903531 RepID=UPI002FDC018C